MKQVLCALPNASVLINGIIFTETPDGMLSAPIADDIADSFTAIAGFTAVDVKPIEKQKPTKQESTP